NERELMEQGLGTVLRWCWDRIAEPVLARLGLTGPPEGVWPRLWWCPTGPLTLLPLHAAGQHEFPGDAVVDRVVSSYTPTLRALREARRERDLTGLNQPVQDRLLIVAMPETKGQPALPNVRREVATLAGLPGIATTVLEGRAATVAKVRDALAAHRWAHF